MIYIRPRLLRWKDANPDQSWLWAYRQVLGGKPAPTTRRTAHLVRTGTSAQMGTYNSRTLHLWQQDSSNPAKGGVAVEDAQVDKEDINIVEDIGSMDVSAKLDCTM